MPYRLQTNRLYVHTTGEGVPVAMAVSTQIVNAMYPVVGLLAAILQVRPLILTDEEYNRLPSHQDAFTYEPPSPAMTAGAQAAQSPSWLIESQAQNARLAQAEAVHGIQPDGRRAIPSGHTPVHPLPNPLRQHPRTESEVRNQGRSNHGDTEPEDL